jgi:flavin reductase (DIM6/NTAB) family NADH-FMN oxidoreductase RutF
MDERVLPVDKNNYRQAMSCFPTGVAIVSILNDQAAPIGVTVNSLTSVSLSPVLILFCLGTQSQAHKEFVKVASRSGRWWISLLASNQSDISQRFAAFNQKNWDLTPHDTDPQTGLPIIKGAVAHLSGVFDTLIEAGDHTVFIAKVSYVASQKESKPLIYLHSSYQ